MSSSIGGRLGAVQGWAGAMIAALVLAGCGGEAGGDAAAPVADAPAEEAAPEAPEVAKTVDPATAGVLAGRVRLDGSPPERESFKLLGEAWCIQQHPSGHLDDRLLVDDAGNVQNAFAWISGGLEGYTFEPPTEAVVVDQVGCLFEPRIVGVQLGQPLEAANSDEVMHNVHTKPELNRPQNFGMPRGSEPRELRLRRPETMIEVVCDVHAWMRAWIGVVDHPFFQVTGADGSFRFEGVPPGSYTVSVWHETLGTRELAVEVGEGQDVTMDAVVFSL